MQRLLKFTIGIGQLGEEMRGVTAFCPRFGNIGPN